VLYRMVMLQMTLGDPKPSKTTPISTYRVAFRISSKWMNVETSHLGDGFAANSATSDVCIIATLTRRLDFRHRVSY